MTTLSAPAFPSAPIESPVDAASSRASASYAFTILRNASGLLTKRAKLGPSDDLLLEPVAQLADGTYRTERVGNLEELASVINSLGHNEALAFGVAVAAPYGTITTRAAIKAGRAQSGAIARTNHSFRYLDEAGILSFDVDLKDTPQDRCPQTLQEVRERLVAAEPALALAPMMVYPSAGALLFNAQTGVRLRGLTGVRVYVPVASASDIPALGDHMHKRLVLKGEGFATVTKAGMILVRSIIDQSIYQPSRLDFIGGASCEHPVVQQRGEPLLFNADSAPISLGDVSRVTEAERAQYEELESGLRHAARPAALERRTEWVRNRIAQGMNASINWSESGAIESLPGDFEILLERGRSVTVDEIIANPERFHGLNCLDPVEPDYDGGRVVAKLYTVGQSNGPVVHSKAHGGINYFLRASAAAEFMAVERISTSVASASSARPAAERIAALHGFPTRAFLWALPDFEDGELYTKWGALQSAVNGGDPLTDIFREEVLHNARNLAGIADERDRFEVLLANALRNEPKWKSLSASDQGLLLEAAFVFLVSMRGLTGSMLASPGDPLPLTVTSRAQLVDGLLPAKSVAAFVGAPAQGKSWLAVELAARVSTAPTISGTGEVARERFAGLPVTHGSVLYFASEGTDGLRSRFARWALNRPAGGCQRLRLFGRVPPLSDPERSIAFLLSASAETLRNGEKVGLIVIDVLRAAFAGDENSSEAMGLVAKTAEVLARMSGATVLLIHHSPHSKPTQPRGSSALFGALDFCGAVTKSGDEISLEVTKQKDGPDGQRFRWHLEKGVLLEGSEVRAGEAGEQESGAIVVARAIRNIATQGQQVARTDIHVELAVLNPKRFAGNENAPRSARNRAIQGALNKRYVLEGKARQLIIGDVVPEPERTVDELLAQL